MFGFARVFRVIADTTTLGSDKNSNPAELLGSGNNEIQLPSQTVSDLPSQLKMLRSLRERWDSRVVGDAYEASRNSAKLDDCLAVVDEVTYRLDSLIAILRTVIEESNRVAQQGPYGIAGGMLLPAALGNFYVTNGRLSDRNKAEEGCIMIASEAVFSRYQGILNTYIHDVSDFVEGLLDKSPHSRSSNREWQTYLAKVTERERPIKANEVMYRQLIEDLPQSGIAGRESFWLFDYIAKSLVDLNSLSEFIRDQQLDLDEVSSVITLIDEWSLLQSRIRESVAALDDGVRSLAGRVPRDDNQKAADFIYKEFTRSYSYSHEPEMPSTFLEVKVENLELPEQFWSHHDIPKPTHSLIFWPDKVQPDFVYLGELGRFYRDPAEYVRTFEDSWAAQNHFGWLDWTAGNPWWVPEPPDFISDPAFLEKRPAFCQGFAEYVASYRAREQKLLSDIDFVVELVGHLSK